LRPNASFDDYGVCDPCRFHSNDVPTDFSKRLNLLKKEIDTILNATNSKTDYDCIIGVSGGKDSTRQAIWVRDRLKMKPLLVCCSYPPRQMIDVGASNLENLISLGFDVEVYNPAPETAAKLSLEAFERFGNVCKASEIALFTTVPDIAIQRGIPIIFFGENPALQEGDAASLGENEFDANNLRALNTLAFGGGAWIENLVGSERLMSYCYPSEKSFTDNNIQMFYLGPAWPDWDMDENALFSVLQGLKIRLNQEYETGDVTNASMLDEEFTNINMMIKYYKFGFGRATDLCNELIRNNKISRDDAIQLVANFDGVCSDKIIERYCKWTNITIEHFWKVANNYTNRTLFDITDERPIRKFKIGVPVVNKNY
jgi:N-acetyl sugar amidotransferase